MDKHCFSINFSLTCNKANLTESSILFKFGLLISFISEILYLLFLFTLFCKELTKIVIVSNKVLIFLLIIVIVLAGWNIFTTNGIKTDVNSYKKKIESIQTEIDSAKAVNEGIDVKIDSVKGNVVKITKEIHHIDNNITIIKKQTDEKVNSVDTLTANELEQFFTNRYNKGNN